MKAGDTILIQAGASGLGIAAIQLVKALGGKVMTTVSTEEKAKFVRSLGADFVINRTVDDLGMAMDQHPVDIALDCISGSELGQHVEKMAIGGRWIVIATLERSHDQNRHEYLFPTWQSNLSAAPLEAVLLR